MPTTGWANVTSNLIILATYKRAADTYGLTVENGTLSGGGTTDAASPQRYGAHYKEAGSRKI